MSYNEWFIRDFVTVGIFVFPEPYILVRALGLIDPTTSKPLIGEDYICMNDILSTFPMDRIFSVGDSGFLEWNRQAGSWQSVDYDHIIPASAAF